MRSVSPCCNLGLSSRGITPRRVMHGATAMRTTAEQRLLPADTVFMSLIGTFNLSLGDRIAAVGRRKSQALLAYLALSPQPAESRERLCGLLWSETDQKKAQTSLRQILHGVAKF